MAQDPPTLVYDGECGICRYWVTYWQDLTEDRVIYRAYQEAATDFPSIPVSAFQRAIQLIEPDGHVYAGAAATFRVLCHAPGRTAWWWCYSDLPGFAALTEWAYAFLARRRNLLNLLSKLLWGPSLRVERYTLVSWIFLRLFGAIYVVAFASLGVQILGLIGHDGLLPAGGYFEAAHQALGGSAYRLLPSRCSGRIRATRHWSRARSLAWFWDCLSSQTKGPVLRSLVYSRSTSRTCMRGRIS